MSTRVETDNFLVRNADVGNRTVSYSARGHSVVNDERNGGTGAEILSYFANGLHERERERDLDRGRDS